MIKFEQNVKNVLPYDREDYIDFFDNDFDSHVKWYGVSFQMPDIIQGKEIRLAKFVKIYDNLFKAAVLKLDNDSSWVVNHEDKDLSWFPNDHNNLTNLRTLFKERNVPNTFVGALIFTKDDLLNFSKELILYPYVVQQKDGFLYKDLNISHSKLQFIIKISGHLNIDFLSTNQELLREIVGENSSSVFNIKEYRGTSLL